jgi:hypothetical protein
MAHEPDRLRSSSLIGMSFLVRGSLDLHALAKAFEGLRKEYPVLSYWMEAADEGPRMVADGPGQPVEKVVRVVEGDVRSWLPPCLNIETSLSFLDVTSDNGRHRVTLWFDHAIADGANAIFLTVRLWSLYTRVVQEGSVGELTAHPVPKSPQQAMVERGIAPGSRTSAERLVGVRWSGSMPTAGSLPEGDLQPQLKRIQMNADAFSGLRRFAKEKGVTIHGLVAGAVALAEREAFLDLPKGEAIPLGLISPVNMRSRVSPPLGPAEVTNFLGHLVVRLLVHCESDPVDLAVVVAKQFRDDLDSGFLLGAMSLPSPTDTPGQWIAISNLQNVPIPTLPSDLVAEDFKILFENDMRQTRDLIAATPDDATLPAPAGSGYYVYTFAGVLSISLMNIPGSILLEVRDRILSRVVELLATMARQAAPQ